MLSFRAKSIQNKKNHPKSACLQYSKEAWRFRSGEKVFGGIALTTLALFLGVLVVYVAEIDLAIVSFIGMALAIYDFWLHLFRN